MQQLCRGPVRRRRTRRRGQAIAAGRARRLAAMRGAGNDVVMSHAGVYSVAVRTVYSVFQGVRDCLFVTKLT